MSVQLNHDLVAVIGNKGNGKSALADIIGLAGGTKNAGEFSFLTKVRFRQGSLAKNFEAVLTWENGVVESISLDENPKEHALEKVKYLPQRYLETLCNNEDDKFENELKKVIFSHVDEKDRHQKTSLNDLIQYKSETIKESIRILSDQLLIINEQLMNLENKATPNYISNVLELLKNKEQELEAHLKQKPEEVLPPDAANANLNGELLGLSALVDDYKKLLISLNETIESKKNEHIDVKNKIATAQRLDERVKNFEMQYSSFLANCDIEINTLGLQIENIITLNVDVSSLRNVQADLLTQDIKLANDLSDNSPNSLIKQREALEFQIKGTQSRLDEPTQKYHIYKRSLFDWETKRVEISNEIIRLQQNALYLQSDLKKKSPSIRNLEWQRQRKFSLTY